jgi:hypothetical protein
MSRVITFSRTFPAYHPRAGEPTYFVEKLYKSILKPTDHVPITGIESGLSLFALADAQPKHHTIRAGHRWKVGDWFSPRVWSGKPYNSKMITIAPDIQIKHTWDVELDACSVMSIALPGERQLYTFEYDETLDDRIAANDGLSPEDFYWWFSRSPEFKKRKAFEGQIICWNENIEYL